MDGMDGAEEARFLTEYWLLFLADGSCYLVEADALLGHLAERGRRTDSRGRDGRS